MNKKFVLSFLLISINCFADVIQFPFNDQSRAYEIAIEYFGEDYPSFLVLDMDGKEDLNILKKSLVLKDVKVVYIKSNFLKHSEDQYSYSDVKEWMEENGFALAATDFDDEVALIGREFPFFGHALFLKK